MSPRRCQEHYSTVGLDEKRSAVRSVEVLRHLPKRGSADTGTDASVPANDTAQAQATIAAK
jgi:hypothetical protein